jgi:hypothetical protein
MSDSPWGRPITGEPLDYVPLDAPTQPIVHTRFTAYFLWRAAIVGSIAAAAVALIAFPTIGLTAIALGVVAAAVWGGSKLADHIDVSTD